MTEAPFIGIQRHRLITDGGGVTTLAAFRDCTLRCAYCLNPQSLRQETPCQHLTPQQLYEQVKKDELYFLATDGGVCFGGGEPCLRTDFIEEFCKICPKEWLITIETALNVPSDNIRKLQPFVNLWIVDIKDMNPAIYQAYTGKPNRQVIDNLVWLNTHAKHKDKIILRLPIIPKFNTEDDRKHSRQVLIELGYENFDEFEYVKQAIGLEVEEYLLKPIDSGEIRKVFEKTKMYQ